ncbi:MAG: hypothetical protein ABI552_13760, partial [Casimicrobiaceae bacterium]
SFPRKREPRVAAAAQSTSLGPRFRGDDGLVGWRDDGFVAWRDDGLVGWRDHGYVEWLRMAASSGVAG